MRILGKLPQGLSRNFYICNMLLCMNKPKYRAIKRFISIKTRGGSREGRNSKPTPPKRSIIWVMDLNRKRLKLKRLL